MCESGTGDPVPLRYIIQIPWLCGIGNGDIALQQHGRTEGQSAVDSSGIHLYGRNSVKLVCRTVRILDFESSRRVGIGQSLQNTVIGSGGGVVIIINKIHIIRPIFLNGIPVLFQSVKKSHPKKLFVLRQDSLGLSTACKQRDILLTG